MSLVEGVTPEQLQKLAERALRIGRLMYLGDDRRAKEFQKWFMNIAQLEDGAGPDDCVR